MPDSCSTLDMQKFIFALQLPRKPSIGDEIVLKGVLCEDAKMFSVNFCSCDPSHIVYHLGIHLDGRVVHCSRNDSWERVDESEWIWHAENPREFTLKFHFGDDEIKTCFDDIQEVPDLEHEHRYPIDKIHQVQLWEDI